MLADITVTTQRQNAARAVGDDAEVRRLEEMKRPLQVRLEEASNAPQRPSEAKAALYDRFIEFWRANPFDPHTI